MIVQIVKCNKIDINCDIANYKENDSVQLAIRPEELQFKQNNQDDNMISGIIKEIEFLGSFQRVYFEVKSFTDELIIVDVPSATARKTELDINKQMNLYFSKEDARIYST